MDERVFPNGRHRNKTYLQVFETDKDFCHMVLSGEKSRFIPDDFLQYLKDKKTKNSNGDVLIKERDIQYFLSAFDENNIAELVNIIGLRDEDVELKQVHSPCNFPRPNTFFGVFYQFFIQKHIANVANADFYSNYINTYTTIFPFPVSNDLSIADFNDGGILAAIKNDDIFTEEMESFLNKHFGQLDLYYILETFFANILNCRSHVVDEREVWNALRDENLTNVLNGSEISPESTIFETERRFDYLSKYPRLNYHGVERYREIYRHFDGMCELYRKRCRIPPNKYDRKYLRKLPEINFYELYSLLDVDMFNDRPFEYLYRIKKYLFFFVNALKTESNPVFFIDDVLFECLLNYTIFKDPSSIDVLDLKYELSLLSLVYVRKFNSESIFHKFQPNDEHLILVKTHLDSFSDLEDVSVGRYVRTEVLDTDVKVSTNEMVLDICYRHVQRDIILDFLAPVLEAALIDENVERLVIYNAYLGQETSIRMPEDKQKIVEFIRRLNGSDLPEQFDPEKLLFRENEEFYETDVANWRTKFSFNFRISQNFLPRFE